MVRAPFDCLPLRSIHFVKDFPSGATFDVLLMRTSFSLDALTVKPLRETASVTDSDASRSLAIREPSANAKHQSTEVLKQQQEFFS